MTTREQVQAAINQLRAEKEATALVPLARASEIITAAGIGDTWLGQCLMYELDAHPGGEAMVWQAWEAEQR